MCEFGSYTEQNKEEMCLGNLRRFNFKELQSATSNFSSKNLVGKGGFGNVYKGCLHDGSIIAVKRLKDINNGGGEVQFQTELEMISLAVHRKAAAISTRSCQCVILGLALLEAIFIRGM